MNIKEIKAHMKSVYCRLPIMVVRQRVSNGRSIEEAMRVGYNSKSRSLIKSDGRECCDCGKYKPRHLYSRSKSATTRYTSNCKECRNAKKRKDRESEEYRERERQYKTKYNSQKEVKERQKHYNQYRIQMKKNIPILQSIWERPLNRKKAIYNINDFIRSQEKNEIKEE